MKYPAFTIVTLAIISSIVAMPNNGYVERPWSTEDIENHKNSE